jgi:hypothetical protein
MQCETATRIAIDLDDTSRCPVAPLCEGCGRTDAGLRAAMVETNSGVHCRTLCSYCLSSGRTPRIADRRTALALNIVHCQHLGIDYDDMMDELARQGAFTEPISCSRPSYQ